MISTVYLYHVLPPADLLSHHPSWIVTLVVGRQGEPYALLVHCSPNMGIATTDMTPLEHTKYTASFDAVICNMSDQAQRGFGALSK